MASTQLCCKETWCSGVFYLARCSAHQWHCFIFPPKMVQGSIVLRCFIQPQTSPLYPPSQGLSCFFCHVKDFKKDSGSLPAGEEEKWLYSQIPGLLVSLHGFPSLPHALLSLVRLLLYLGYLLSRTPSQLSPPAPWSTGHEDMGEPVGITGSFASEERLGQTILLLWLCMPQDIIFSSPFLSYIPTQALCGVFWNNPAGGPPRTSPASPHVTSTGRPRTPEYLLSCW